MQRIELKLNLKAWFWFFIFFIGFSFLLLMFIIEEATIPVLLFTAICSSVAVVGSVFGIFYFYQKKVILTDEEIKKIGYPDKSIAYEDIERIKVGMGGFNIYDEGSSDSNGINVTNMYSNFNAAKELLNKKLAEHDDIQITGWKRFINKYLDIGPSLR